MRRVADQRGVTLVETVLALALAVMMLVPILGWATFAIGEQRSVEARNVTGAGLSLLRTYVQRDVTGADAVWTSGDGLVDCVGGEADGGDVLMVAADGPLRRAYVIADGDDGPTLWRRSCNVGGPTLGVDELVGGVSTAVTRVDCTGVATVDGRCDRITVRVTTPELDQASISASVRADGPAGGRTDPLVSESAPLVSLTADPTEGGRGMTVRFSSAGTVDPLGGDLSYAWDFGDGATSTRPDPTHTYTTIGRRTALLTVTNAAGIPSTDFVVIDVANRAPEAVIASPDPGTTVHRGEVVSFSAEGSNDDGDADFAGRIASYLWDFGDGTTSTDPDVDKAYSVLSPSAGFVVRLTVTDDLGRTNQAQVRVVVENREPTVRITATPSGGAPPLAVTLAADVEDETDLATNPPLTYQWDLGDGTTSTDASPRVTYQSTGTRTVRLTVTDDAGATATASTSVVVTRQPTAAFTATPTSGRAPLAVALSNTTTDPDNQARSWSWSFGNGTTSSQRNPGTVTFGVDPASDTFVGGTYTVQLTVTGSGGSTSTATRTVTVTGAPVPTNLRNSRSGTSQTYRWNAATPNVNGYQVWIDFVGGCSDRTLTTTGTSQVVNYGGSSSNTCARQAHDMRVRSRDSVTGKWGAWSPPRRVN